MRSQERILWFACEWSPACGQDGVNHYAGGMEFITPSTNNPLSYMTNSKSYGGSFLWIERLVKAPDNY